MQPTPDSKMTPNTNQTNTSVSYELLGKFQPFFEEMTDEGDDEHFQDEFYSILPDFEIDELAQRGCISNYVDNLVRQEGDKKIISYGLSSYGYDVRLSNKFKIFSNINHGVIDPLAFDDSACVDYEGDYCIIPPNSYILGVTIERFKIPDNVLAICVGKSTYARCGAIVNVTPIEPGFVGEVVIEIANSTPLPLKVYANMGIAQFIFFRGPACEVTYRDRKGKYQGQSGIVTPRV